MSRLDFLRPGQWAVRPRALLILATAVFVAALVAMQGGSAILNAADRTVSRLFAPRGAEPPAPPPSWMRSAHDAPFVEQSGDQDIPDDDASGESEDAPPALIGAALSNDTGRDNIRARFSLCHSGGGRNCVVDGDTFWLNGVKIRVADIDTPETHPARCAAEAARGTAATRRLHALLNAGPFSLEPIGQDADRYGRKLRRVMRDGENLGDILVSEGLARPYSGGYREGWC